MKLVDRYQQVIRYMAEAHRPKKQAVKLLAVTKKQSIDLIRQLISLGQRDFAESYVSEAVEKITELNDSSLTWHFIGPIQSNKCQQIAKYFDWVHSVDRLKVAEKLDQYSSVLNRQLNVCVQVNLDQEVTKSGVSLEDTPTLVASISAMTHLKLRGLMLIPKQSLSQSALKRRFEQLNTLYEQLKQQGYPLDTLSMGMSGDYPLAIESGSHMVRVGLAIFGERVCG